jgi:hypothetical protein
MTSKEQSNHWIAQSKFDPVVAWLLFVFIFFVPVTLIAVGTIPFAWRYWLLTTFSAFAVLLSVLFRIKPKVLGFTSEGLTKSLISNAVLSVIVMAAVYMLIPHLPIRKIPNNNAVGFYVFYLLVSSPLQEFLYRSFMFKLLDDGLLKQSWLRILLASVTFSFLHLIYKDAVTLGLTFVMGLVWCTLYQSNRNIYGLILSHTVVGIATIAANLV